MLVLLIAVVFGLAIGYFATQNVTPVTIQVAQYALQEVPLYLVVVGSLLIGLFIAWILYFAKSVSSTVTIYGKNHAVKRANQTATVLEERVHELEAENARLRTQTPFPSEPPRHARP
jgi:cell shape-determining protein MreC